MKKFQITVYCTTFYLAMVGCYTIWELYEGKVLQKSDISEILLDSLAYSFLPILGHILIDWDKRVKSKKAIYNSQND